MSLHDTYSRTYETFPHREWDKWEKEYLELFPDESARDRYSYFPLFLREKWLKHQNVEEALVEMAAVEWSCFHLYQDEVDLRHWAQRLDRGKWVRNPLVKLHRLKHNIEGVLLRAETLRPDEHILLVTRHKESDEPQFLRVQAGHAALWDALEEPLTERELAVRVGESEALQTCFQDLRDQGFLIGVGASS